MQINGISRKSIDFKENHWIFMKIIGFKENHWILLDFERNINGFY